MATTSFADDMLRQAVNVKPDLRQYEWQKLEFTCFIHFGVNTFSGREWGTGKEDPATFNPTQLDAEQWVKTAKAAGMKMMVLVCKHHDGFCMWPSRFTDHSIKASPYKNGQGDLIREVTDACHQYGIKVGVYLSPADLNAMERGIYGKTQAIQRTIPSRIDGWTPKSNFTITGNYDEYNTYFMNQLFEVLTEYGEINEVWFDGANPKPGTGQTYVHSDWYKLIRALQPNACIFGKGPDIRWVGNEHGGSRAAEWSTVVLPKPAEEFTWDDMTGVDLGSREKLKTAQYLHWYPAETDVPIRQGWFYRDETQQSRSADELIDIYYRAVGGNSVFLLNLSPNREGLIPDRDVKILSDAGEHLRKTFANNLIIGSKVEASATRDNDITKYGGQNAVDNNDDTYWMTGDGTEKADLTITLPETRTFNIISLQEAILQQGQRIERFAVDAWIDNNWKEIGSGETVGYRKFIRIPEITTSKVRVRILESRFAPTIKALALYREPVRLLPPKITRDHMGNVTIATRGGGVIRYTTDGTNPTLTSQAYSKPIPLTHGGTIKAILADNNQASDPAERQFGFAKGNWKILDVSSSEPKEGNPQNAIDDNPKTYWHTEYTKNSATFPHFFAVDFSEALNIKGITYLPRQGATGPHIAKYEVYISADGKDWGKPITTGEFGNIVNNPVEQTVVFDQAVQTRFIKLVAVSSPNNSVGCSIAEFGVIAE